MSEYTCPLCGDGSEYEAQLSIARQVLVYIDHAGDMDERVGPDRDCRSDEEGDWYCVNCGQKVCSGTREDLLSTLEKMNEKK